MPYASNADLVARYPSLAGQDTSETLAELTAASDWIDGYCHRTFGLDDEPTIRYFAADDRYVLDLGAFEIGTTDGVVVDTDDGSGTYATTVADTTYQLEPVNALNASPSARPYTSIRAIGTHWPMASVPSTRQERVRVTAHYGWPAVPDVIQRVCLTLVSMAFENPGGVKSESIDGYSVSYMSAGGVDIGVPSFVLGQLQPYVRGWAA